MRASLEQPVWICCITWSRLGTVVWADDAAILGSTDTPDKVVAQLQVTTEVILLELKKMGMQPNMGKGKTEATLHVCGSGSRRVRQLVHHHCKSKIGLNLPEDPEAHLRLVHSYVHLRGVITHDATMRSEIRRKLAVANATLDNYSAKVLNNRHVSIQMRVHIYRATVGLALTYNIGTWPSLTKGDSRLWSGGVFRLYRRLLLRHFTKDEQFHMTEGRLLSLLKLPHPEELLHFHRLSHYALCARRHNQQFWALAGLDNDWLQTVQEALQWMYRQVEGFTVLPEPCTDQASRMA